MFGGCARGERQQFLRRHILPFVVSIALALVAMAATAASAEGTDATVRAGDECLAVHEAPDEASPVLACVDDGATVERTGAPNRTVDGATWTEVEADDVRGWVLATHLAGDVPHALGSLANPIAIPDGPNALDAPPAGGLTIGFAGTTSPERLVEAQEFPVHSVVLWDVDEQRFLVHVPGAPDFANTLAEGALERDAVVLVRRDGLLRDTALAPAPIAHDGARIGSPATLPAPPPGGLTMGPAGTNDVDALIAVQRFPVSAVHSFDVPTQRWLSYVVGAPAEVNTLSPTTLAPNDFVVLRRTLPPSLAPEPEVEEEPVEAQGRSAGIARISYYYCERGSNRAAWGDGGGFCGHMANGQPVFEGGAACARAYMGQRFKIAGDPTDRVYTCTDTGGAVTANHRDIFFHNSDDGSNWWRQVGPTAEIFIVD